jgi:hypothetical protein
MSVDTSRGGKPVDPTRWGKVETEERAAVRRRTSARPTVVDADMHLYEPRGMWAEYADPAKRHLALDFAEDDLGHTWLVHRDRQVYLAEIHHPAEVSKMGQYRQRVRQGLPPEVSYDEGLPREFWDPARRVQQLEDFGVSAAVVFPNYGLLWERPLKRRPRVHVGQHGSLEPLGRGRRRARKRPAGPRRAGDAAQPRVARV